MQRYRYQVDFAGMYYRHGFEEGLKAGREEARHEQEPRRKGLEEGWRTAVLVIARTKLETIPADDLPKILAITDLGALIELFMELGRARSAFAARCVLARRLHGERSPVRGLAVAGDISADDWDLAPLWTAARTVTRGLHVLSGRAGRSAACASRTGPRRRRARPRR